MNHAEDISGVINSLRSLYPLRLMPSSAEFRRSEFNHARMNFSPDYYFAKNICVIFLSFFIAKINEPIHAEDIN